MAISVMYKDNAPGVIVEYIPSNSMSIVASGTAIPAIACPAAIFTGKVTSPLHINNWLEFLANFPANATPPVQTFYESLKTYFSNGGSRCYLIKNDATLSASLARLDEVTLFVQAGQEIADLGLGTVLETCKIFGILDGPQGALPDTPDLLSKFPAINGSENAATYYPWLTPLFAEDAAVTTIPPSTTVAAVYCRNDAQNGPWSTPANVSLQSVMPAVSISDSEQAQHLTSLNMIRNLYRRPAVVWGGRTQKDDDEWRYISVKRLFNMLERDIRDAMRSVVFNPNVPRTWMKAQTAISSYLTTLWERGGLMGRSAGEAFFVRVGRGVTMTNEDILNGVMIVEIGVAAVRPAEFIVLRFSQIMGE